MQHKYQLNSMRIHLLLFIVSFVFFCSFISCRSGKKHVVNAISFDIDQIPDNHLIISDGEHILPVILSSKLPSRTRDCALELLDYLEKITGLRPTLLEENQNHQPESAIWIGVSENISRIFPDFEISLNQPEEFFIHSSGKHLLIAGRDVWEPNKSTMVGRNKRQLEHIQQEYGTCNAIYTFLQDYMDVRWLGPGEIWEDIVYQPIKTVPPIDFRYFPQFTSRNGILRFTALGENRSTQEEQIWARRQRLQYSSLEMDKTHAFTDWWEKYHVDNPDFFALLPNGKREPLDDPGKIKMCVSNQNLWQQWLVNVEEQLKREPYRKVFSASPNDGWNRGQCVCEHCEAWGVNHADSIKNGNLSDRDITFANKLATLLMTKYPEEEFYVEMLAYGFTRTPPLKTKVHDRVIINSVHSFYNRSKTIYPEYEIAKQELIAWSKLTSNIVWRPNMPNYAGNSQGLPDFSLKRTYDDVQFVAQQGVKGLWIDTHWQHWSTQMPQYYILSQIAWNPSLEFEQIMGDFYKRAYGPGHESMRKYWEFMDDSRENVMEKLPFQFSFYILHDVFNDEWLNYAKKLLLTAQKEVLHEEKYADRIAFHLFGLEMVEKILQLRKWVSQIEMGNSTKQVERNIDKTWQEIDLLRSKSPAHAFNYIYVLRSYDQVRMHPLHYKFPNNARLTRFLESYYRNNSKN